jgi:hypothetical protein
MTLLDERNKRRNNIISIDCEIEIKNDKTKKKA